MKMKEDLQKFFDEYCGVDVHKVNNFTKEQLKESVKDYLLDNGTKNYVVKILVNELSIGQMMNIIQKAIDMNSSVLYVLQINEVLEY